MPLQALKLHGTDFRRILMTQEIAMLHDVTRCTACRGCQVACKQWKQLPTAKVEFDGLFQSPKNFSPINLVYIRMRGHYKDGNMNWVFSKLQCMHCGTPACAKACPSYALEKRADGPVLFHEEKCVGCGYCVENCPFKVPTIDKIKKKSTKCNLCFDRIDNGMVPSCAKTCTSEAIFFGSRAEMTAKALKRLEELKPLYPDANLYGVDTNNGVGGTSMMYILSEKPSVYGLPDDPQVPESIKVWKEYVQPGGKILIGAAAVAVAGATVLNSVVKKDKHGGKNEHE